MGWKKTLVYRSKDKDDWDKAKKLLEEADIACFPFAAGKPCPRLRRESRSPQILKQEPGFVYDLSDRGFDGKQRKGRQYSGRKGAADQKLWIQYLKNTRPCGGKIAL